MSAHDANRWRHAQMNADRSLQGLQHIPFDPAVHGQDQESRPPDDGPPPHETFPDTPQLEIEPSKPALVISPTAYELRDASLLKRRQWLYGRHYIRGFLSTTIGRPGQGKTALSIFDLLDMISRRSLVDKLDRAPLRGWFIGEDPLDELMLRLGAACEHWGITADDLSGRLFVNSTHELPPLRIAEQGPRGAVVNRDVIDALKAAIVGNRIDVLVLDPLIKFHGVPEADPSAMETVVRALSEIADSTGIAIDVPHHTRKAPSGSTASATVDDGRGASSIIGAVRSARVTNAMTMAEADRAGISEADRWQYFRVDSGKANMSPPESAKWYRHISHVLPCGESVGVVAPWQFPDAFASFNANDLPRVRELARTGAYRADSRSPQWFGHAVADLVGADIGSKADRGRINHMIKTWLKTKVLNIETRPDEQRKDRQFIVPGPLDDGDE